MLKKIFILPIRFYQHAISPLLGPKCRYSPTCSHYMVGAIEEWGILKGTWLGLKEYSAVILGEVTDMILCRPILKEKSSDISLPKY